MFARKRRKMHASTPVSPGRYKLSGRIGAGFDEVQVSAPSAYRLRDGLIDRSRPEGQIEQSSQSREQPLGCARIAKQLQLLPRLEPCMRDPVAVCRRT